MGGHGGLNILPQKRWNVYNFDNREKVRKDEEAAAREESQKQQDARRRDSEIRLQTLRQSRNLPDPEPKPESPEVSDSGHINLFGGLVGFESLGSASRNDLGIKLSKKDEEKSRKRRREEEEKAAAIGPEEEKCRLGYGLVGRGVKAPWYASKNSIFLDGEEEDKAEKGTKGVSGAKGKKTIDELREERMRREKAENRREWVVRGSELGDRRDWDDRYNSREERMRRERLEHDTSELRTRGDRDGRHSSREERMRREKMDHWVDRDDRHSLREERTRREKQEHSRERTRDGRHFSRHDSYHATRKTPSIVKSVLDPETLEFGLSKWLKNYFLGSVTNAEEKTALRSSGWAPFDSSSGTAMLGEIDVAFLAIYAFGMYFVGHLGDRVDLRILLTLGMIGTGVFTFLFGTGYWLNIHNFYYFLGVQMIAGLFQSSGWPSVVAVVGNWFGKSKRGLILGIWNAHTSVGNIAGSLIAAALLKYGWGWSFAVPGLMISLVGLIVFFFLPVNPESLGVDKEELEDDIHTSPEKNGIAQPLLEGKDDGEKAVGFMEAWRIPGVAPFALCLFFSKLVAYTFLYWLPFYISHTAIGGTYLTDSTAGTLSTVFDVGGVVGGILAGHISDRLDARALTAATFMYSAIPALYLYRIYGSVSLFWNVVLMFITGMLVNGPYALITTAVSADLGTHSSLKGNSRALATVTAIIDGTGSVGTAFGPLLTGYLSSKSWSAVFMMLMIAALVAGLLLTRLIVSEVSAKLESAKSKGANKFQAHSAESLV